MKMFNLVLNHHCLHIRKEGGQQCLAVNFNWTLINALRLTINAQIAAKLFRKHSPPPAEELPKTGVQGGC